MADDLLTDFRSFREGDDQDKAHAHLSLARGETPEAAARRDALAQRWGVGPETAKRQETLLSGAAQAQDDQEALSIAPKTTGFLAADPGNAAVAHDHIKDLSLSERLIDGLRATFAPKTYREAALADENLSATIHAIPGAAAAGVHSFVSGLLGVPEAAYDIAGAKRSAGALRRLRNKYEGKAEALSPKTDNLLARGLHSGVVSAATTAPAIGVGIAQPEIGMGLMIAPVGGQAYGQARDEGKDIFTSLRYAATQGGAEYATEKLPFGKLLGDIALKAPFWKTVRNQLVREIPGEQIATLIQSFDKWSTLDSDKQSFADYLKTLPAQEAETLIATAVNVGANVTAGHALDRSVAKVMERDTKALQAPQTAEALDQVVKATSKLPLLQRSPERFHDAMERLADGVDVLVPAEVVQTYLQSANPEEARTIIEGTGIADQLNAATPEQDIVIRGADYLTFIGPTEAHKAFRQDLKIGPGAISINEAKEHEAEREQLLAQAAERALNRGAEIAQIEDPAERVRQDFHDKAVAAGVPEAQAQANAVLQAAYYSQRAARNSSFADAWDAYQKTGLDIQAGGAQPSGSVFNFAQGTPEFKAWFGDSKVVDETGAPLIVYHGTNQPIESFSTKRGGKATGVHGGAELGMFFTSSTDNAGDYAENAGKVQVASAEEHEANVERLRLAVKAAERVANRTGKWDAYERAMEAWENAEISAINAEDITGQNIVPVYLNMRNPKVIDRENAGIPLDLTEQIATAKAEGYDGFIMRNVSDPPPYTADHYVVFDPAQIKSVFNEGTFNPTDPRILKQGPRGQVSFSDGQALVQLFKSRNASTLIHEAAGHIWLDNLIKDAADPAADQEVRDDLEAVKAWWRANAPEGSNLKAIENPLNAKADDIRPFHEMFARAAEAYVMEGKSPTENLRSAFAKFRQWLVAIYKDFTRLNVPMTDDMRGVFDRLIATPEAMDEALQDQGLQPFFTDPTQAGMTQAEYDAYLRSIQLADETSHDQLLGKVMTDIRRRYTTAWRSERAALVDEYAETINETPEMQALTLLESGEVRLSRQAITDLGFEEGQLYRRQRPYVFDEGMHPDDLAEQVGLSSGQALLQFLVQAQAEHTALREKGDKRTVRQARIETLADAEMQARHGDILNDGTIGEEAISAIHDMRRSEVLLSEVRALIRKAGAATSIWSEAEMQRWAKTQIAGRQLSGVRPHIYAAAEGKAGRDALKALVTDDFTTALDAKFRQLLNMHLYRAARDAREEIDKGKKLFDTIAKARNGTIAKTRDMDMVGAARQIIAGYGFEGRLNDGDYMAKVERYDPELWGDLKVPVAAALAAAKPVDELTYDEFVSLREMVEQLWEKSRTSRQMEIDFQKLEKEDIANDLGDQLGDVKARPSAYTHVDVALRSISALRAALRRVESWVSGIDGGNKGPWRTYVWQPISEAATRYRLAKTQYLTEFVDLLQPISEGLKRGKIEAPELAHTFGTANSGVGKSELLHAVLHTGNDSNKRKLLLGRGWAVERADGTLDTTAWDKFINRMHTEGVLTQADYDFAQSVWDLLERMKPDAQRAHRRVFGRYFEEVTANSFTTPFGTYKGGYVPAIVDTFLVQEQALNAQAEAIADSNDAQMFPSPNRGFTKARVEYNKPLALDLRLLPQHIDKVLKFTHMTAPVRDVLGLLKEGNLAPKLEAFDPVAIPSLLLPWLNRSARQIVETPPKDLAGKVFNDFFRAVRHRTGMGIMIGNISNTLQQLTGWAPVMTMVKKRHMTRALLRVTRNPTQAATNVATMSPYMSTRMGSQIHDVSSQIEQLLLDPTKYQQVAKFTQKHAYILQGMAQNYVDLVAWQAAFEQAIDQGDDYPDAVRFADSVIRQTQGSLAPEDVSRFETGPPVLRIFTQFYSYFGAQSNLIATEAKNARGNVSRLGYVYITALMLPAVVADLIRRTFGEGWDDDDDDGYLDTWLDVFFGSQFRYAAGFVPFAGALTLNVANRFNDKTYDDTLQVSPVVSSAEQVAGIPKDIYKLVTEGKNQKSTVRDVATLMTLATGVPLFNAAARPLGYLADINEGKVQPTSGLSSAVPEDVGAGLDFARGLMTGTASRASKVAQ